MHCDTQVEWCLWSPPPQPLRPRSRLVLHGASKLRKTQYKWGYFHTCTNTRIFSQTPKKELLKKPSPYSPTWADGGMSPLVGSGLPALFTQASVRKSESPAEELPGTWISVLRLQSNLGWDQPSGKEPKQHPYSPYPGHFDSLKAEVKSGPRKAMDLESQCLCPAELPAFEEPKLSKPLVLLRVDVKSGHFWNVSAFLVFYFFLAILLADGHSRTVSPD